MKSLTLNKDFKYSFPTVKIVCGDKVYTYYYNHENKIAKIVIEDN